jgi:hypothetical protein
MKKAYDHTGKVFGYWTVLHKGRTDRTSAGSAVFWVCRCVCGTEKEVRANHLTRAGKPSKSCGCMKVQMCREAKTVHGHGAWRTGSISPTYWSWQAMIGRCTRPSHIAWKNYGGRGIKICKRWMKFENFLADMGERPAGLTLDRKKVNGHYTPGNCQWATRSQQAKNKRIKSTQQH